MTQATLIQQTVVVKKVIPAAQSKFGKASIIVPSNGKDEFLGLNEGVDEAAFVDGGTYHVEISVSKTGKRYVNKILNAIEADGSPQPAATTTHTANGNVVNKLDRDTRITLMNVGNIASNLSAGFPDGFSKTFNMVREKYKQEGIL